MFKRIKELEIYNKYKNLKNDSQASTLASLGLWLIFFIVIIIFTRGISSNKTIDRENKETAEINNYEYTYQNNDITIFGEFYNGKQIFTILNNKYYYDGQSVYMVKGNSLELMPEFNLNILKITLDFVEELTSNITFTENNGIKEYLVPLVNFLNLYEIDTAVDLSEASNYNIIIRKYYDKNNLYKEEVVLSNYYKINSVHDSGQLIINLYNKNKLNNFTLEYDKMLGVK